MKTILTLFGTRPELIKLAPVMAALDRDPEFRSVQVSSAQHKDLLTPFLKTFGVRVDHSLDVMKPGQSLNQTAARVLSAFDQVLVDVEPDFVLVQGDTTTAFAGGLAAYQRRVPVGHVEAGLRSGDLDHPFPEEMNRRLLTQLATLHFAATEANRAQLLSEGVSNDAVVVTGNPVVDALEEIRHRDEVSEPMKELLARHKNRRIVALTLHRRESQGGAMQDILQTLASWIADHEDTVLLFPVHPNPAVREAAQAVLKDHDRIECLEPLDYRDFLALIEAAWLVASDSGGVQEEAPSLGTPLLVLRETTERPEALASGVAKLIGLDGAQLRQELDAASAPGGFATEHGRMTNPFGDGHAAKNIVAALRDQWAGAKE